MTTYEQMELLRGIMLDLVRRMDHLSGNVESLTAAVAKTDQHINDMFDITRDHEGRIRTLELRHPPNGQSQSPN